MAEIHCHRCGGFIADPAGTVYREGAAATPIPPHSGLCACGHAEVYGPAATPAREVHGVHHLRSASRN